jgi:Viral coat protein P2 N-terminal domain
MPAKKTNLGRLVNFLSGFQGVSAGSVATINPPVNQRYHRLVLNCSATTKYSQPQVVLMTTAGVIIPQSQSPVITFTNTAGTLSAPVFAANSVGAAGATGAGLPAGTWLPTGGTAGFSFISDPTGVGQAVSVTTAGGVATVVAMTAGYTAPAVGPILPSTMITSLRALVNGVVIRDITPAQELAIQIASGYVPQFGSLPMWFTEPLRNMLRDNELTSWDLAGQSTFQLQIQIASGLTSPTLTGVQEFDFSRNARRVKNSTQLAQAIAAGLLPSGTTLASSPRVPFLQPVAKHAFGVPISAGRFDITTLPWNNPQTRLWLSGSIPGNIYQVEVMCDGNMIYQATSQQMYELAAQYGFQLGNASTAPTAGGGGGIGSGATLWNGTTILNQIPATIPNGGINLQSTQGLVTNTGFPLDGAVLFDPDNRPWKACRTAQSFILRVYSNVAQNLTVLQETLPGAFSG